LFPLLFSRRGCSSLRLELGWSNAGRIVAKL
jgi:hypothetical protein